MTNVICLACGTRVEPRGDETRCECGSAVQPTLFDRESPIMDGRDREQALRRHPSAPRP